MRKLVLLSAIVLWSALSVAQTSAEKIMAADVKPKYQPFAVGFDLNVGFAEYFDMGIRATRNFTPRFGWDIIKVQKIIWGSALFSFDTDFGGEGVVAYTGLRFPSNRFGKNKAGYFYTACRGGIGYYFMNYGYASRGGYYVSEYYSEEEMGFSTELELGLHGKMAFLFVKGSSHCLFNFEQAIFVIGCGMGIDIGRVKEWGKLQ
ncbi:MAG: hypothetical protein LBU90_06085 [Bacteroidales bacterium]|jgi:hypothetical protein|nr:hypothetical protein [Bacteroidales bacterium]